MTDKERIEYLERVITRAWALMGGAPSMNTVLACLPAGGTQCERWAERVRDDLGAAIGKPPGLRGMRTENNEPAPRDDLDQDAEETMALVAA